MVNTGFNIFNASAGSGKTYQITKAYLKRILSAPGVQTFRQLLAITFTNKAVAEMKERILSTLYAFSKAEVPTGNRTMFKEISDELQLEPSLLRQRAGETLKGVLHNYTFFEILTIDKFTHKIIRAFAKDLKISQHFEVELDTDLLLDEAVGELLSRVGHDPQITRILVNYALEKVDSEKSWDISYDLKKTGRLLFDETHYLRLQQLEKKEILRFSELKSSIKKKMTAVQTHVSHSAQQALATIERMGFSLEDFPRLTLPNHFRKIAEGETDPRKLYQNQIEENLTRNSIVKKSVLKSTTALSAELLQIYLSIKKGVYQYRFYKNAYNNVLPLTVLNEISKALKKTQSDKEILHISEFNKLISNEIRNQPAPYIYERLGERYRHYYIDEFQDTSVLQWQNLIPLIANALEGENQKGDPGSLFLVGDVKQAIYRWRGGNPEQLLQLCEGLVNPFSITPSLHFLHTNWRSYDEIICFNNGFFSHIASKFANPAYKKLYEATSNQKTAQKKGGYVEISFLEEGYDSDTDFYLTKVVKTIEVLTAKGFAYRDVTILVRKNNQGVLLANHLTNNAIPVISSEGLLLKNSREVSFLVALLQFMDSPEERASRYEILEYLLKNADNKHDRIVQHLDELPHFLATQYGFDIYVLGTLSTLDILERAIACFDLAPHSNAYVTYFMDQVIELDQKIGGTIYDFLRYWELKKDALAISMPDNLNAVTVMTVHKAKGLEFKFVLFPFADTKINDPLKTKVLWIPVNDMDFPGFDHLLLNASKELEFFSEASQHIYFNETRASELDDINVLYVALTRAVLGLFVYTSNKKSSSYGSFFEDYLQHLGIWDSLASTFTFGDIPDAVPTIRTASESGSIPYGYTTKPQNLLGVTTSPLRSGEANTKGALERGNILHDILARIHCREDIERIFSETVSSMPIPVHLQQQYKKAIIAIIEHPQLKQFFGLQINAKNEIELLDTDGSVLRPDRLIFSKNGVTLMDYKTGKFVESHKRQLEKYAYVLQRMGYVVLNRILVYITKDIKPVFI